MRLRLPRLSWATEVPPSQGRTFDVLELEPWHLLPWHLWDEEQIAAQINGKGQD